MIDGPNRDSFFPDPEPPSGDFSRKLLVVYCFWPGSPISYVKGSPSSTARRLSLSFVVPPSVGLVPLSFVFPFLAVSPESSETKRKNAIRPFSTHALSHAPDSELIICSRSYDSFLRSVHSPTPVSLEEKTSEHTKFRRKEDPLGFGRVGPKHQPSSLSEFVKEPRLYLLLLACVFYLFPEEVFTSSFFLL